MVNANADALGIIFPNSYDEQVPDLVNERLMASIPFASRYRMVDFILSSMVNCGIGNVSIIVRKNYHSLMDHLGSGREWDLARKKGGLNIVPPYSEKKIQVYSGRVEALANVLDFLKWQKEKYVVMADTNIACNFDFKEMLIPEGVRSSYEKTNYLHYTFSMAGQKISKIFVNSEENGVQNVSMNIYVMERQLLIDEIKKGFVLGNKFFERDVLAPQTEKLNIQGYEFTGYQARIDDMKSYFDENMKLLKDENLDSLFLGNPIYTKVRDDNPTRYINGSKAKNVMVADGCVIEGEIENSILFRGVKVAKGAKVKNCILMQDTVIEAGAEIEYVVSDKYVTVSEGKQLKGTDSFPVFIAKDQVV